MSFFLLQVQNGVPGFLINVGELWAESVDRASYILRNQILYDGCPKVKEYESNWSECFDGGYFETTDPKTTYYFLSDE